MEQLQARWQTLWQALGAKPPAGLLDELLCRYQEPHRKYHTVQHLSECLASFDELRHLAIRPAEVELALWLHDAIYDLARHDNEERSAQWACETMLAAGLAQDASLRVHALIMATRHDALASGTDAEILTDADLAILAAAPDRFCEYEQQIRAEYAHVPAAQFAARRKQILDQFLKRERIFATDAFHARYEQAARHNLRRAIAQIT